VFIYQEKILIALKQRLKDNRYKILWWTLFKI